MKLVAQKLMLYKRQPKRHYLAKKNIIGDYVY